MPRLIAAIFLFAAPFLWATTPVASVDVEICDGDLLGRDLKVELKSSRASFTSDESRPALEKIISSLRKYKNLAANGTSKVASIYKAIEPQIDQALARAENLSRKNRIDQNEMFIVSFAFTQVVDFAGDFTKRVAYYADGIDGVFSYNDAAFAEIEEVFFDRYSSPEDLQKVLTEFAKQQAKGMFTPLKGPDYTKYLIDGMFHLKPDEQDYFFQYKYIALMGVAPYRELFENRELGVAYYGVSVKPFSPADGSHGGSEMFVDHDMFHAFFMKFKDLQVFQRLGITTATEAKRLKTFNNQYLKARIREWDRLANTDPGLNAALEAVLFAVLHEQSESYPTGVGIELGKADRRDFYTRVLVRMLQDGDFGPRLGGKTAGREKELVKAALAWLRARADVDAAAVLARLRGVYAVSVSPGS